MCIRLPRAMLVILGAFVVFTQAAWGDATVTINTSMAGTVTADSGTTVNVVTGGAVTGGPGFDAIDVSAGGVLNMSDGSVTGGTVVSGWPWAVGIYELGGQVKISGGNVGGGRVSDGGSAAALWVVNGTATITGGTVRGGQAGTPILGGAADAIFGVNGSVTIWGGTIQGGYSAAGGSAANAIYNDGATIDLYGGTVLAGTGPSADGFYVLNGSLNIYGTGFNHPYGTMSKGSGTLTGILSDGSALNTTYDLPSNPLYMGTINLIEVPEPASAGLLTLGCLTLLARRRKTP